MNTLCSRHIQYQVSPLGARVVFGACFETFFDIYPPLFAAKADDVHVPVECRNTSFTLMRQLCVIYICGCCTRQQIESYKF